MHRLPQKLCPSGGACDNQCVCPANTPTCDSGRCKVGGDACWSILDVVLEPAESGQPTSRRYGLYILLLAGDVRPVGALR